MYSNQGFTNKLFFYISPTALTFGIIGLIFIIAVILFLIFNRKEVVLEELDDIDKYSNYILEYAISIQKLDDLSAQVVIDNFQFDNTLYIVSDDPNYVWNRDAEAFLEVILAIQDLAVITTNKNSIYYKSEDIWKIVEFFIERVMAVMPIPAPTLTVPWGTNWYQFSISYPRFLVICAYLYRRLFEEPNLYIERVLSNYISNYFKNPDPGKFGVMSLGYLRDGANAIMMAVPYVGGHLLSKDLDLDDKINTYVRDYVSLNFVKSGEGLFPDYGYVFHLVLRAYGYIYSSIADFELMSKIYGLGIEKLSNIYKIMEHPTIPLHFSPYFTRSYSCSSNRRGELGFYTIQSTLVCSIKTKDWLLQFNGQRDNLCFYEADKTYENLAQLWTFARVFLYLDSDSSWFKELVPYYPGVVTYNSTLQPFPTTTTTTTVFNPKNSKTILVKGEGYIGMWQSFDMKHDNSNWDVSAEELILVTKLGYHRVLKILPRNMSDNTLTISINLGTERAIKSNTIGLGGKVVQFEKNTSYIYSNINTTFEENVIHPKTSKLLKRVYVEPTLDLIDENIEGTVAYSNLHSDINEVKVIPTIKKIDLMGATLEKDPKYPDYLFLHDRARGVVSVGKYDGTFNQTIRIPTSLVDDKIKEPVVKGFPINAGNYIGNTNSIYQLEIKAKSLIINETN